MAQKPEHDSSHVIEEIEDLAELGRAWEKLGTIAAHKQWSKDIEPYIVSGTPHWQIFRVL